MVDLKSKVVHHVLLLFRLHHLLDLLLLDARSLDPAHGWLTHLLNLPLVLLLLTLLLDLLQPFLLLLSPFFLELLSLLSFDLLRNLYEFIREKAFDVLEFFQELVQDELTVFNQDERARIDDLLLNAGVLFDLLAFLAQVIFHLASSIELSNLGFEVLLHEGIQVLALYILSHTKQSLLLDLCLLDSVDVGLFVSFEDLNLSLELLLHVSFFHLLLFEVLLTFLAPLN